MLELVFLLQVGSALNSKLFLILVSVGWTVSFMMTVRGGGPSSGYIAAGFAGGKRNCPASFYFLWFTSRRRDLGTNRFNLGKQKGILFNSLLSQ
jgi:hypothetical protein